MMRNLKKEKERSRDGEEIRSDRPVVSRKGLLGNRSGVTLTELLVTMIIMGFILVVGMPALQDVLCNRRLETAVRGLKVNLDLARMRAISENHEFAVVFSKPNRKYEVIDDQDPDPNNIAGPVVASVRFPIGVDYSVSPPANVAFRSLGTLRTPSATIRLENNKGATRSITITKSGYVRLGT